MPQFLSLICANQEVEREKNKLQKASIESSFLSSPCVETLFCKKKTDAEKQGGRLWQYRLWSFQGKDTKLESFLAKNQL